MSVHTIKKNKIKSSSVCKPKSEEVVMYDFLNIFSVRYSSQCALKDLQKHAGCPSALMFSSRRGSL